MYQSKYKHRHDALRARLFPEKVIALPSESRYQQGYASGLAAIDRVSQLAQFNPSSGQQQMTNAFGGSLGGAIGGVFHGL